VYKSRLQLVSWQSPHNTRDPGFLLTPLTKTQLVDFGLFGLTKQAVSKVRPGPDKTAQSSQLIRVLCASNIAATPKNIIASFGYAGLVVQ
jgi:hypothetical protein